MSSRAGNPSPRTDRHATDILHKVAAQWGGKNRITIVGTFLKTLVYTIINQY